MANRWQWVLILALVYWCLVISFFTISLIVPDGVGYYVYLESAWTGGDFYFGDDFLKFKVPSHYIYRTETGLVGNHWTIGPALMWSPLDAIGRLVCHFLDVSPSIRFEVLMTLVWISSTLMTWIGLSALILTFARATMASGVFCAMALLIGSPLLFYSTLQTAMPHAASFMLASLTIVLWHVDRHSSRSIIRSFALGLLIGLASTTRPQNMFLVVLPISTLLTRDLKNPWFGGRLLVASGLGSILGFSPQLLVWQLIAGGIKSTPHLRDTYFTFPAVGEVLFSAYHGLFSWSPVLLLAAIGYFWIWKNDRVFAVVAIVFFILQLIVNASFISWWGGLAFGARRFLSTLPFFYIGLIALLFQSRIRPYMIATITVLSLWTLTLALSSIELMVFYPYSDFFREVFSRLTLPPLFNNISNIHYWQGIIIVVIVSLSLWLTSGAWRQRVWHLKRIVFAICWLILIVDVTVIVLTRRAYEVAVKPEFASIPSQAQAGRGLYFGANMLRGEYWMKRGNFTKARDGFLAAAEDMSDSVSPLNMAGLCALRLGDLKLARDLWLRSITLDSNQPLVRSWLLKLNQKAVEMERARHTQSRSSSLM